MTSDRARKWYYKGFAGILWHRIRELRDYVYEIERKFEEDKNKLDKRYKKEIEKESGNEENAGYVGEIYGEELHTLEGVFLRTFRYSVLVSIYSLLESSMDSICQRIQQIKKLPLSVEDLRGEGIKAARTYLVKACSVNFPEESNEWQEILKLNRIRNCIVHTNGNVVRARDKDKLLNIIESTKGLSLEHERYIIIDREYTEANIERVETFLLNLHEKVFKESKTV